MEGNLVGLTWWSSIILNVDMCPPLDPNDEEGGGGEEAYGEHEEGEDGQPIEPDVEEGREGQEEGDAESGDRDEVQRHEPCDPKHDYELCQR